MSIRRLRISASLAAIAIGSMVLTQAPGAQAAAGTIPLAQVLDITKPSIDRDWTDFDILTGAINFVLKAKPKSAVAVLADGKVALTAFVPTDRAFRGLVKSLTGKFPYTETQTLNSLAALGADTIEKVLLYHVVLGDPIPSSVAAKADDLTLTTAQTGTFTIKLRAKRIYLQDIGIPAVTPKIFLGGVDINLGNNQIAHTIDAVLVPAL